LSALAFVAFALSIAATSAATFAQSRAELSVEFHQSYPLAAGGRVSLENIQGAVRVIGWDRNEVRVDAVKRAYSAERLAEADIRVEATADAVRIKTRYPQNTLNFNNSAEERFNNPASVEYTLSVPRGARLDSITLVNGALSIEGMTGEVKASSVNGHVAARGLSSRVRLSVVNGALEAAFNQLGAANDIELTSVNGPVTVTLPSDSNAELRANSVHGTIGNDFGLPVRRGPYVGRDLAGTLGAGGASVKLSSVNGPVRIRRAADGRPLSPVTNHLSETRRSGDEEDGDDEDDVEKGIEETNRELREAEREILESSREIERATRETERERQDAAREAARELRESKREIEEAKREAEREHLDAAREAERERREIEREKQEIERERRRGTRTTTSRTRTIIDGRVVSDTGDSVEYGDPGFRQQESKSFKTTGTPRVRVETFEGYVNVRAWDKPEVSLTAFKRASDEHEMKGIKLRAEQSGGEIVLAAEFDKSFARAVKKEGERVVAFSSGASVSYELFVPRSALVRASTGDGRLSVEGVNGELDLRTGDGPIQVTGGRGRLHAQTGDGRINVTDYDGEAEARTGDGRISLDGRFTRVNARTGDGSISLALPANTNATIETNAESVFNDGLAVAEGEDSQPPSRGVRRWRIGQGGNLFSLQTGEGRIFLRQR
jgi:DUF4097 and DUF4098 domain-containing protein YvlB